MPFDGCPKQASKSVRGHRAIAIRVIDYMLELFGQEGEGWCQGTFEDVHGKLCMLGALSKATNDLGIENYGARNAIHTQIKRVTGCHMMIQHFNDTVFNFPSVRGLLLLARANISPRKRTRSLHQPGNDSTRRLAA